jgi:hypothetical protein
MEQSNDDKMIEGLLYHLLPSAWPHAHAVHWGNLIL